MAKLTLPASIDQLHAVNKFLADSLPPAFAAIRPNLELAAEELLVNVFSYAYAEGQKGSAVIDLQEVFFDGAPMVMLTVSDEGAPFNPFAEAEGPDITLDAESRPIGGLGVFLIRNVTTHQAYRAENGRNIIDVYFAMPNPENAHG